MPTIIDGTGSAFGARVTKGNRIYADAVSRNADTEAALNGDAYNINTGDIALTGTAASSLIYVKNNETRDLVIDAIALGIGTRSATITDTATLTLIKNPTGGDIISDATAVDMNENRNFGSNKSLTVDAFKGKDGGTITGGSSVAQFYQGDGRLFAAITMVIPKGNSIALKIDLNTSGGANVYLALVCHLLSGNYVRNGSTA